MSDFDTVAGRFSGFLRSIGGDQTQKAVSGVLASISAHTNPIIPVARGKLINSQTRKVMPTVGGWKGEISYGAGYALFVHEAPGTHKGRNTPRSPKSLGFLWDPAGEPKFLEKGAAQAVRQDVPTIWRGSYIT